MDAYCIFGRAISIFGGMRAPKVRFTPFGRYARPCSLQMKKMIARPRNTPEIFIGSIARPDFNMMKIGKLEGIKIL
jgi:hypothetical protein